MSRLNRLKEKRKKQFIKTAMSSLALTLVIGSSQTMTTYAWFTDTENINNDLVITMGSIVVNIGEGLNVTGLNRGDEKDKNFDITNNGTLRQHIRLKLDEISDEILQYINYKIEFSNYNGKNIKSISNEELLSGNEVSLKYEDGSLVVLQPKDVINATAYITIDENMPKDLINSFVESPSKFNLNVIATQVNDENNILDWGFSDIATQENSLQFNKIIDPELPQEGNVEVKFDSEKHVKIIIKDIPILNNPNVEGTPEIIEGTGQFSKELINIKTDNDNRLVVEKKDKSKFDINNTEFNEDNTLTVKFKMTDATYRILKFKFRMDNPEDKKTLMAYYTVIGSGDLETEEPSEPEVVEPPKEEVEEPTEPEVVEPPKEEVEKPSEPEVVEPPKEEVEVPTEPEVVEPPKEEITEIPKQPEAIEPPKENEGIQE